MMITDKYKTTQVMSVPLKCPICNIGKMVKNKNPEMLAEYDAKEKKPNSHGILTRTFYCEKCSYIMLYRE